MQLVLASGNQGKLEELQTLLSPLGFELIKQSDLGVAEAPEPYCTFLENALSKARHASQSTGLAALADDAGLCVEAFNGQPGVDTAYYATKYGLAKSDINNIKVLLEQLAAHSNRKAQMVSVLVALRHANDPEPLIAIGKTQVQIATQPQGEHGFGYDPVLLVPQLGQTFAQLPPAQKHHYSHRGKAAAIMLELLKKYWLAE